MFCAAAAVFVCRIFSNSRTVALPTMGLKLLSPSYQVVLENKCANYFCMRRQQHERTAGILMPDQPLKNFHSWCCLPCVCTNHRNIKMEVRERERSRHVGTHWIIQFDDSRKGSQHAYTHTKERFWERDTVQANPFIYTLYHIYVYVYG